MGGGEKRDYQLLYNFPHCSVIVYCNDCVCARAYVGSPCDTGYTHYTCSISVPGPKYILLVLAFLPIHPMTFFLQLWRKVAV